MERKESITGLKGIGACVVAFAWHYQHFAPQHGSPFALVLPFSYSYGWLMVELFFMLSGFGMMIGYGTRIWNHSITFAEYILRRIKRLYPLFILSTVLVIVFELIHLYKMGDTFVYPNFDVYHLILNVLLLQDGIATNEWSLNSPSWYISICMIMYIMFFVICNHMKCKRYIYYVYIFTALSGIALISSGLNYPIFNSLIGRGMACFSIGVVLEGIYECRACFNYKRIGLFAPVFLIICYILYVYRGDVIIGNMQMAFILGFGPMIILSLLFNSVVEKILDIKMFTYLGGVSTEIYLLHFPIQCAIRDFDILSGRNIDYSKHFVWIIYVATTIFVACIYKYLLKQRYESWLTGILSNKHKGKRHG